MKAIQAYRFALDLTQAQERDVYAHAGAARVAHNWALARVKAVMDQRTAERSYGVPDEQLTESLPWSLPALRKAWNAAKTQAAPWWSEVSKEAFNTGLDALARGLKNWTDSRKGARAGRPVGFPRFKSRRRTTPSVRFTTGAIRVEPDRTHVVLPRLGTILAERMLKYRSKPDRLYAYMKPYLMLGPPAHLDQSYLRTMADLEWKAAASAPTGGRPDRRRARCGPPARRVRRGA